MRSPVVDDEVEAFWRDFVAEHYDLQGFTVSLVRADTPPLHLRLVVHLKSDVQWQKERLLGG